jgi:hypothetical protein
MSIKRESEYRLSFISRWQDERNTAILYSRNIPDYRRCSCHVEHLSEIMNDRSFL